MNERPTLINVIHAILVFIVFSIPVFFTKQFVFGFVPEKTFLFYFALIFLPLIILGFIVSHYAPHVLPWVDHLSTSLTAHDLTLTGILFAVFLIDYLVTLIIAWISRADILAIYGPLFILLRYVDALILLTAIPKALFRRSDGIWASPTRR